jgi:hypothetical protein
MVRVERKEAYMGLRREREKRDEEKDCGATIYKGQVIIVNL